jgi:hypothetical protein
VVFVFVCGCGAISVCGTSALPHSLFLFSHPYIPQHFSHPSVLQHTPHISLAPSGCVASPALVVAPLPFRAECVVFVASCPANTARRMDGGHP